MTWKIKGDVSSKRVWINGKELDPAVSLKVKNHSPDGFMWGYHGSGPAQLALAILLRISHNDKQFALASYQWFKENYVSTWDIDSDFEVELDTHKFAVDVNSYLMQNGYTSTLKVR